MAAATFLDSHVVNPEATSQWVLGIEDSLRNPKSRSRLPAVCGTGHVEACLAGNSFWLLYVLANGVKVALRACFDPQGIKRVAVNRSDKNGSEFDIEGSIGNFRVDFDVQSGGSLILHYVTTFTPARNLQIEALPRDVVVLGRDHSPQGTQGAVYVEQAGPTAGLVWFSVVRPNSATALYFQNLSSLAAYAEDTEAEPSGSVSANWPELGFALPKGKKPLKAGKAVTISDAYLSIGAGLPENELEVADRFLSNMAAVYSRLNKPNSRDYDWPLASIRTLAVLSRSGECRRRIKGRLFLNAYLGSTEKPPESMVHLSVLVPLLEYEKWRGRPIKLAQNLLSSLPFFFDSELKTIVRWLPGTAFGEAADSEEEKRESMDSWYLIHTLLNLARLVEMGHREVLPLLTPSLEHAIKVAHAFDYEWPVFYDPKTLRVIKAETKPGEGGEHDVPGLYTHLMLQAFEITKEARFLDEAERAAKHLQARGFKLLYQTNNTMMTAIAMVRLSRATGNRLYADIGVICMANVIARLWIWNADYGYAKTYDTFLGIAPLQDAEYIASYEEHEFYAAATTYLTEAGSSIHPALNVLLAEYCKYLLHRGRYYFCEELPKDAIAEKPKEGLLRPDLFIPLEDLRTGWAKSGQVGQEVYGAAAAFILTSHGYIRRKGLPFLVHAEYPIFDFEFRRVGSSGEATFRVCGSTDNSCRLIVLADGKPLPKIRVAKIADDDAAPQRVTRRASTNRQSEFLVGGGASYRISWSK